MFCKKIFRKKYQIRYYVDMKNPPFNDVYFCLGKPNTLGDKDYEDIQIWSKKDKLLRMINKPYIIKEEILNACHFPKQRKELDKLLKR